MKKSVLTTVKELDWYITTLDNMEGNADSHSPALKSLRLEDGDLMNKVQVANVLEAYLTSALDADLISKEQAALDA